MSQLQLGVIGLGTMGQNLARNAARTGAKVAVYNRTTEIMEAFLEKHGKEGDFVGCKTLEELVAALQHPFPILLMVKAGKAVDSVIEDLLPHLKKEAIIVDGGNSHYRDTDRRCEYLEKLGIHFIGMGVSGGEEGALHGPSMMPGGEKETWKTLEPLFQDMAADDELGGKCVSYIGPGGAGHFVKMVHNGIEYAIMQLIAESYDILKNIGGLSNAELHETFKIWNEKGSDLHSFLMEITAEIFARDDDLIDVIKDAAGQKGTGKWTTIAALEYGVAIPTINAAVDARILSGSADMRNRMNAVPVVLDDDSDPAEQLEEAVRAALKLSVIAAYIQGFTLIEFASKEEGWKLDRADCARIWRGGCIIRSELLGPLQDYYGADEKKKQVAHDWFQDRFSGENQKNWRKTVALASQHGIGVPAMAAALSYWDSMRRDRLPQNLTQAQRDFFGHHGFERTDKEGEFHMSGAN